MTYRQLTIILQDLVPKRRVSEANEMNVIPIATDNIINTADDEENDEDIDEEDDEENN